MPWDWQSPVGSPRLLRSLGLKGPLWLGYLRQDAAPAPRPEGVCECVGGRGCGWADWELDGYPEWRRQGVEAGNWEASVVLLLSLSTSFSVSLTCGFWFLTCLGGGVCLCVFVCVFVCMHARVGV